ncbi:MAG: hypothetical protein JWN62_2669 [Acidimicrobiales bacterium]|jgi:hypothetical protein|nr:hypothetical protein [Acidimicrobiales bacterium]
MKYLLLLADDPDLAAAARASDDGQAVMQEYFAFTTRIAESGELVAGDALHDVPTASTLRIRGGSTTVTDGPFAETKEQIGGFYVVEVPSLDRALELAAQIPAAKTGSVEVRPIMDFSAS